MRRGLTHRKLPGRETCAVGSPRMEPGRETCAVGSPSMGPGRETCAIGNPGMGSAEASCRCNRLEFETRCKSIANCPGRAIGNPSMGPGRETCAIGNPGMGSRRADGAVRGCAFYFSLFFFFQPPRMLCSLAAVKAKLRRASRPRVLAALGRLHRPLNRAATLYY